MRIGSIIRALRPAADDALESRLVWILGSPRSGSTWLLSLMAASPRVVRVDEPGIGVHLGVLVAEAAGPSAVGLDAGGLVFRELREDDPDYFFSNRFEDAWRPALRRLILERLRAQLGDDFAREGGVAVLKDPNGSQAADVIFSALPGSKLIFLLRDGRDVVDSHLDLLQRGAWGRLGDREVVDEDRLGFLEGRARVWLKRTEIVQRAFDALPPANRLLVRYEELLWDTRGELSRVFEWLGLDVDEDAVAKRVGDLAYDALPEERKGPGKFARAATPGLWRENLSEREQRMLDELMGPKLEELGYQVAAADAGSAARPPR